MTHKVKLILNPMADMGRAWKAANALRSVVNEFEGHVTWSGTVYPTHGIELARQAAEEGYDKVIAMGGDGTVHEVINGLMQIPADKRPAFGVVPIGSGNDFAFAMGVPTDPAEALALALKGKTSLVDIGLLTDENGHQEYFDNTVGLGFSAIVTIRSHTLPLLKGFLMYLVAVIQTIFLNHEPAKITYETDKETWQDEVLLTAICNGGREGGGFLISPTSKPDDGKMEFVTVKNVSRPMMFRLLPEVMQGTHGKFKDIHMGECKRLKMTSNRPLYIHADGEIYSGFGSNLRSVSFELLPKALKVVKG